jgi:hypothetical protein
MFDNKKSIHTLGFVQCIGCHYPYWWFPQLFQKFSLLATIHRVLFMYLFHMAHAKDTHVRWFINMFFIQFPPNHQAPALYLVLNDERCLNSLL